jgi:hypothetical protein
VSEADDDDEDAILLGRMKFGMYPTTPLGSVFNRIVGCAPAYCLFSSSRLMFEKGNDHPSEDNYERDPMRVIDKLLSKTILPEELFHILFNMRFRLQTQTIRVLAIHKRAFAIFSAQGVVSDIYIFDADCTRLLRRMHVPRSVANLAVVCKGFHLIVIANTKLYIHAPRPCKEIRLRAWNPA